MFTRKGLLVRNKRTSTAWFLVAIAHTLFVSGWPLTPYPTPEFWLAIVGIYELFMWGTYIHIFIPVLTSRKGTIDDVRWFWSVSFSFVLLQISAFAWAYKITGLQLPEGMPLDDFPFFYFSVVTWTTLGDGAIIPMGYGRAVAGIQALSGYVFMALALGIFLTLLSELKPKEKTHENTETDTVAIRPRRVRIRERPDVWRKVRRRKMAGEDTL